ncbi:MAG: EF-hand domain-containing protein [Parasphingopyxis sp.]
MKITKKTMTIGAGAAALIVAGAALAQPGGMRADANGDGNVTRAELNTSLDERFARADANSDGAIDASEREAMRSERRRHRAGRGGRHGGEGRRGGRRGHGPRMERLDTNGDGIVTRDEAIAPALARFDRADANGDGQIDQAERTAMREQRGARRAERRAQRRANRPNPDANGDGRITRDEFGTRAVERFNSADANGDGIVTREERRAARAARRAERGGQ